MSEMFGRVARAISEAAGKLDAADIDCLGYDDYEAGQNTGSRVAEALTRAAIEAMREPTPEIIRAAYRRNDDNDHEEATAENWRASIDAALTTDAGQTPERPA